MIAMSKP
jgi:hypothetical protein